MVKGCSRERGKGQSRKAPAKLPLPVLEIELLQLRHGLFANQLQELGAGHALTREARAGTSRQSI